MSLLDQPHRRKNLLTGEYVLVSPHRAKRPWQGEVSAPDHAETPSYDPNCYLCPGNARMGGAVNPAYEGAFIFANDFPALLEEETGAAPVGGLFETRAVRGEAHVICYHPDHSKSLSQMSDHERLGVVEGWCDISARLGAKWANVQIFENRGAMMGASSPHPHGQVWAGDFIPQELAKEEHHQRQFAAGGANLLEAVIAEELDADARIVAQNTHWLCIVPHWAAWPFETLLIAREKAARLEELSADARANLAAIMGELLARYDGLFQTPFPYSFGWHGAPHALGRDVSHWRLHAHFYPPLLRSAEIRKHMVGFELLAEIQRDLTPEQAAERLQAVSV